MIKPLIFLMIAITFAMSAIAQDTTYFSPAWQETTAKKAAYYRTKFKTDSGWQVTDHYLSGQIQMKGFYADDSFHISQGNFAWFDSMTQFIVTKTGKISDLKVINSANKYLDAEALRVMRLMSDWEPAIIGGIPADAYEKQPTVFHL